MITFKQFIIESNSIDSIINAAIIQSTRRYEQPFLKSLYHEEILQFARDMHKTLQYTDLELEPLTPRTAASLTYSGSVWFQGTRELDKWGLDLVLKSIHSKIKKMPEIEIADGEYGIFIQENGDKRTLFTPEQFKSKWADDSFKSLMILVILKCEKSI